LTEPGSSSGSPLSLVLDTSVAVKKWYLPEDLHDEAIALLRRAEAGDVDLLAPGTIQPEFFNALWWQHRREGLPLDSVRDLWRRFALNPAVLYAPEDLMPRAAEIALQTQVIIYDGLFLALAENTETVVVTADGKLLKALEGTSFSYLVHPLADVGSLVPDVR
jgi:predicted nucleic acid-binding protein